METLDLNQTSSQDDGHLKSLFWPAIKSGADVDYLGAQGYWVCCFVSIVSFIFLLATGRLITAIAVLIFYYLGGVGVREHSRYAAAVVLAMYLLDTVISPGIVRILFSALLLSNLRATWIASGWKPGSEESALPPRLTDTFADRFAETFPAWLWPKTKILYYIFSAGFLLLVAFGLIMMILGKMSTPIH